MNARSTTKRLLAGVCATALAMLPVIGGCRTSSDADVANGDDPLKALAVSVPSTRYTAGYWQSQANQDPALWQRAVSYCEEQKAAGQGSKPNCSAVESAKFEMAGRAPVQQRPRRSAADQGFKP